MIRELGVEGFKQHKKDTFARGHRLHRFWRLFCFSFVLLEAVSSRIAWTLLSFNWSYRVVEEFLETGSVPEMDEVKHIYWRICEH